jgi:RHS repeat-associated protein
VYNALGQQAKEKEGWENVYSAGGEWIGRFNNNTSAWLVNGVIKVGGRMIAQTGPTWTEFVHPNALGSTAINTNQSGAATKDILHDPWGRLWSEIGSGESHFAAFNYRNAAGLDPTLARMYAASYGRWLTPDPSGVSVNNWDPQSWNRYSYTLNNPLRYVDENGKWPKPTHNAIIRNAFPGLSPAQQQVLINKSEWVDRLAGQTKQHVHEHAMKLRRESAADAKREIDQNIRNHEQAAQREQGGTPEHANQINGAALGEFGLALHPVADRTSPAHTDASGDPRDWNGVPLTPAEISGAIQHKGEEENVTPEQMATAVKAAQDAFRETFGDDATAEAVKRKDRQNNTENF